MVERALCDVGEDNGAVRSVRRALQAGRHHDELTAPNEASEKFEKSESNVDAERPIGDSSRLTRDPKVPGSRFSLFKWFKKAPRESAKKFGEDKCPENSDLDEGTSELSSNESVSTLYSTATVRSFAFSSGTLRGNGRDGEIPQGRIPRASVQQLVDVGPFGAGASKVTSLDATKTLPANILSKRRDITARYSLQSYGGTGTFGSCGNFTAPRLSEKSRPLEGRARVRVHVRGKRRAPEPPIGTRKPDEDKSGRRNRQKRRAPRPPNTTSRPNPPTGIPSPIVTRGKVKKIETNPFDEESETESASEVTLQPDTNAEEVRQCDAEPESATNIESVSSEGSTVNFVLCEKIDGAKGTCVDEITKIENSESDDKKSINLIAERNTGAVPAASKEDEIFPGAISNDSLILQDGVLYSRREYSPASTLRTTPNDPVTLKTHSDDSATLRTLLNDIASLRTNPNSFGTSSEAEGSFSRSQGRGSVTTGSQTSVSAMPRPWYKRSVFENSRESPGTKRGDVFRNSTEAREEALPDSPNRYRSEKNTETGTLSRLHFFLRNEKSDKKENKRKSGISILTNISELDKEAAAIVQEEQMRTRSMLVDTVQSQGQDVRIKSSDEGAEALVQEIVNSAIESSPRRGTRALISKFNAISNITKVTVNSNFFVKNCPKDARGEISKVSRNEPEERIKHFKSANVRTDKDLSSYFLPVQKVSKNYRKIEGLGKAGENSSKSSGSGGNISEKISDECSSKIHKEINESSSESKISKNRSIFEKNLSAENSPKFSRLRVNVFDEFQKTKNSGEPVNEKIDKICDTDRKEFPNVFTRVSIFENREKLEERKETSTSSQVRKVLDILVEAEKNERQKNFSDFGKCPEKSGKIEIGNISKKSPKLETGTFFENPAKVETGKLLEKSPMGERKIPASSENSPKTDVREMLKEMKHSLPKRPKVKKSDEKGMKKDEKFSETDKKGFVSMNDRRKDFFSSGSEKSALLSPVTVSYPPPIRIGQPPEGIGRSIFRVPENSDYDRQKVSSSAQTSGNLRKISAGENSREKSQWRNENAIYQTSGQPGTSGLKKNSFQLIRPREFAEIEAVRTLKNSATYANVIEDSLYANVPGTSKISTETSFFKADSRLQFSEVKGSRDQGRTITEPKVFKDERSYDGNRTKVEPALACVRDKSSSCQGHADVESALKFSEDKRSRDQGQTETETVESRIVEQQNMNTLAVNRLLRKLEAAIASGHHQQAAGLAKELARLKIHCSVVRQRTNMRDVVNVKLYIEDKLAHQGPIPLRLARSMTVGQLKTKVFTEFEIPTNVQRWIVGKNLADDDSTTLEELNTMEGSSIFLYLVAPDVKTEALGQGNEKAMEQELPKDEPEKKDDTLSEPELEKSVDPPDDDKETKEEQETECITDEARMERYEALISLENCDVIPNSEPIECPICFVTYGPKEGVILRDCLHMFCRPCIANTIHYCEEAEVKCPYRDTEYTCESTLQEREIKALVEPEVYQQHLAKSIAQAENNAGNNAFHCKTPDCPGWCIYDDNVNNFLCPVCGANNCLTCQVIHAGKNCRQYQEELRYSKETDQESKRTAAMLEEMVDRGEAMPCPTCAVVLMKKWGCDWLRCSMCKTEICWVTRGPRWGPGGKGDTSGGCRCGEKGVKCHPRCNYCH